MNLLFQEFVDRWRYNAKRASQAQMRIKILEKLWGEWINYAFHYAHKCPLSPELKPVIPEPEVMLRFPDVDKLAPPILQLSEVSNHNCLWLHVNVKLHPPTHMHAAAGYLSVCSRECYLWTSQLVCRLWLQDRSGECVVKVVLSMILIAHFYGYWCCLSIFVLRVH